ncbi:putative phage host specificity protein (phage tail protein) (fragment) [Xenorhabdus bovienii str. oregonense]|uniref:Putative phage host specificity protein ( phage tail protein) n=2 Tax=Xenorhabdus bovienii TaxID=40576 RepID=A0A077NQP1_XENBV
MFSGRVLGGRISAVDGRNITLDRVSSAKVGERLILNLPSGKAEGRTIQAVNGQVVTVTTEYSELPATENVWAIDATDLAVQQFRVTGIKEGEDGVSFEITAVEHNPDKYDHIDTGTRIDERPISVIPPGVQPPPKNVGISSYSVVNQGIAVTTLRVTWDAAESAIAYEAEWRRDNGNWISAPRTSTQGFEVPNIYAGRYQARVRAINASEISSLWANAPETHLKGKEGNPPAPLGFRTTPIIFGIQLDWGFAPQTDDTLKTEIQYSKTNDGEGLMLLADIPYPQRTHTMQGLAAGVAFYFRARLVDKSGNQSPWTAFIRGESSLDTNWITDAAGKEFLSNKAGQRLQEQMDFNSEAIMENAALTGAVVQRQLKVNGDFKAEILHVQTTQVSDREAFAEDMKKIQADVGENAAAVQTKATAVFDIDGNGYAINYVGAGVKYNNQFYKAGMVIGAEVKNGEVKTQIGFSANNFVVMNPDNGKLESVFMIKDGQVFIREVLMDKAMMREAILSDAIKSKNYVQYKAGFLINAVTGAFEFNDMRVQAGLRWANGALACYDPNGKVRAAMGYIGQFR